MVNAPSHGQDHIRIEQLQLLGRVGVTESERATPQRLTLSITVWPRKGFQDLHDDIAHAIDYSCICEVVRLFVETHSAHLIETLAVDLTGELLRGFAVKQVEIELCKFVLPDTQHVAVVVTRMAED